MAPLKTEETNVGDAVRQANADVQAMVAALAEARDVMKQWKEREADLKSHLLVALDGVDALVNNGKVIARKRTITSFRFSTKEFQADHPDLYGSYKTEVSYTKVEV